MGYTKRGYCWTSEDDMIIDGYRRDDKPVINTPTLASKPSVDYDLMYRIANARNGYKVQFDAIGALQRDGLDCTNAVKHACEWLAKFNELEVCRCKKDFTS